MLSSIAVNYRCCSLLPYEQTSARSDDIAVRPVEQSTTDDTAEKDDHDSSTTREREGEAPS